MNDEKELDKDCNNYQNLKAKLQWEIEESALNKQALENAKKQLRILEEKQLDDKIKLFFLYAERFAWINFDDILKEEIGFYDYE